jgi:TonB family protein
MGKIFAALALILALTPSLTSQSKTEITRPAVQSIRVEKAMMSKQGGKWVEGPRSLLANLDYGKDGKISDSQVYTPKGAIYRKFAANRDATGKDIEKTYFNEKGAVIQKTTYSYDENQRLKEMVELKEKGETSEKSVITRGSDGRIAEVTKFDSKGLRKSRTVYKYLEKDNKVQLTDYDSEDVLSGTETQVYDSVGHLVEDDFYNPAGSRRTATADKYDDKGNIIEETIFNLNGYVRFHYAYEFDSNQNWIKRTTLHLVNNSGTLAYEPVDVTYRTISYDSGPKAQLDATGIENSVESSVNRAVLNGKLIKAPKPIYPDTARSARISGTVIVKVYIDEVGNVISARAMDGPSQLREDSEAAAWSSTFSPSLSDGEPTIISGELNYNFRL